MKRFILIAALIAIPGCASVTSAVKTFAEDVAAVRSHVVVKPDDPDRAKWEKALDAVAKTADLIAREVHVEEK